ncbi:TPA: hypothetical protein ACH3X3_014230 [Trebouxia sp. C0006]
MVLAAADSCTCKYDTEMPRCANSPMRSKCLQREYQAMQTCKALCFSSCCLMQPAGHDHFDCCMKEASKSSGKMPPIKVSSLVLPSVPSLPEMSISSYMVHKLASSGSDT